jgi:Transglutaminase-like superfamily
MLRLSKFIQSPLTFKLLLAEAFLRLSAVSVLIHLAPRRYILNRFRRNSERQAPRRLEPQFDERVTQPAGDPVAALADRTDAARAQDICKAVTIAARYVPGATCLVQSITGCAMLRRAGCRAKLKIGVRKDSSDFHAHAWLENENSILLGGEVAQYTRLAHFLK